MYFITVTKCIFVRHQLKFTVYHNTIWFKIKHSNGSNNVKGYVM